MQAEEGALRDEDCDEGFMMKDEIVISSPDERGRR
jgi:hypothetical protein